MGKSWALIFCWKMWWFCFWALLCCQEHCLSTLERLCWVLQTWKYILRHRIISSSIGVLPFLRWGTRQITCNSAKAHLGILLCLQTGRSGIIVMSNFASEILDFLFVNFSVFLIWSVTFLMFNSTCLIFHPFLRFLPSFSPFHISSITKVSDYQSLLLFSPRMHSLLLPEWSVLPVVILS